MGGVHVGAGVYTLATDIENLCIVEVILGAFGATLDPKCLPWDT